MDGLKYTAYNTIVRNDLPRMAETMKHLWKYHSKTKRAVKFQFALFDSQGRRNNPVGGARMNSQIGLYVTNVNTRDGRRHTVNTYISSVEYDLTSGSPRISVQTQYPDSPKKTREKVIMTAHKRTKNKKFNPRGTQK
jgi:hypothetical protein